MDRSTAKLGTHVTLGTPGEVGQCDSRNNDRDPSCGKEHALVPSCGAAVLYITRCLAFPASQVLLSGLQV